MIVVCELNRINYSYYNFLFHIFVLQFNIFIILKVHFANPVYESMYAGSSEPALPSNNSSSCSAPDEKKGLLQHTQDELNAQDLLWLKDKNVSNLLSVRKLNTIENWQFK